MFSGLPTFDVDFHEGEDGAPLVLSRSDLVGGQRWGNFRKRDVVQLWDPESGYCLGRIETVRGDRIVASILWQSWSPVPAVHVHFSEIPVSTPAVAFETAPNTLRIGFSRVRLAS